ncbi:MAG: hypothetical protein AAGL96_14565 [Pseudomonadota bacterium]
MTKPTKAVHPVKIGGNLIKPGGDIDTTKISQERLASLIKKGRVKAEVDDLTNRADTAGRPSASKTVGAAK